MPSRKPAKRDTPSADEPAEPPSSGAAPGAPKATTRGAKGGADKAPAKAKAPAKRGKAAAAPAPVDPAAADGLAAAEADGNGKAVVIVESPAKARTINKYLGREYVVRASMGHVRDLPKSQLGVDPEKGFAVTYVPIAGRDKVLTELRAVTRRAKLVYLAPDPDREGEAIAWHLAEALGLAKKKVRRVTFHEITKKAVEEAFAHTTDISMPRVYAQQARRVLDRIVGYQLSPLLWSKVVFGLSAGRVQSVAVRLVVEREREIRAFRPEEYWTIVSSATGAAAPATAIDFLLKEWDDAPAKVTTGDAARPIADALRATPHVVEAVRRVEKAERPRPPFTTSLLQQQASIRLRFTAKRTMRLAQQLYEGLAVGDDGPTGLITYMRTDSTRVAAEAQQEARAYIAERWSAAHVPETPNVYRDSSKVQGAHEAIRPTAVERTPERMRAYLSPEQLRLYELVWRRFVSSQMAPATVAATQVSVRAGRGRLTADGREVVFAGHLAALPAQKGDSVELPAFREGETLTVRAVEPTQHFTQPPPRYSEATLVKALEKNGIGRPSTYAPIISTIQVRGYVTLTERRFHATPIGELVTDLLVKHFPRILDVAFTSKMEDDLDEIENAKADWTEVLGEFYGVFSKSLAAAKKQMRDMKKHPDPSDETCPKCGKPMVYRVNKMGRYLGCGTYPKCTQTIPLDDQGRPAPPVPTDTKCVRCGKPMLLRHARGGPFLGCSAYPECRGTLPVGPDGKPLFGERNGEPCPHCGKPMSVKTGRRGPFLACTGFPACKGTKPLGEEASLPDPKIPCETCGKPMAWRRGRRGLFLGCSGYPECKTTKPVPPELRPKKAAPAEEPVEVGAVPDEADSESPPDA